MSRHTLAALGGAFAVALLGGCAGVSDADDGPTSLTYRCDDNRTFAAMFSDDRRQAFVDTPDDSYELVLVDRDANEMDFANNDGVLLTVDGAESYLRIADEDDYKGCTTT